MYGLADVASTVPKSPTTNVRIWAEEASAPAASCLNAFWFDVASRNGLHSSGRPSVASTRATAWSGCAVCQSWSDA